MPSPPPLTADKSTSGPATAAAESRVLLMDLETLVKDRRLVLKKVIEQRFGLSDDPATRRIFSALGLAGSAGQAARLVAKKTQRDPALAEEVANDMRAFYAGDKVRKAEGADALLSRECPVVLITWLSPEAAETLLRTLDLDGEHPRVLSVTSGNLLFPDSTTWDKAAHLDRLESFPKIALTDNGTACYEALLAGIPCLAVPDEWTSFQDFGGACAVLENLKDAAAAADRLCER